MELLQVREYAADIAAQEVRTATADKAWVFNLRHPDKVAYRTTDWAWLAYSTRIELVWCLPPARQWWYTFIDLVLPELNDAALDLEQQGCPLRFLQPLPQELPKRAQVRAGERGERTVCGEAVYRFLSLEYEERDWWYDEWLDEDGHSYLSGLD